MRIAFSGSRQRSAVDEIRDILTKICSHTDEIVHGGCPLGIDAEVQRIAKELGFAQKIFYPKTKDSKGYLARNKEIAEYANVLYAFPLDRMRSALALRGTVTRGGTEHTIRQFVKLKKSVYIYCD